MALETGTFISDLVAANPVASDPLAAADDHLRLIKATVKNTFPNISGAVTKTHTEINTAVDKAMTATQPADLSAAITTAIDTAVFQAKTAAYPVGSIYINATNSTNPGTLLGFGTWVAFGAGRVPVGFNAGDPLFDTAEETGGSKDAVVVSHTHTATVTDPGHAHTLKAGKVSTVSDVGNLQGSEGSIGGYYNGNDGFVSGFIGSNTTGVTVSNSTEGVSGTNANLQPYITVYMWKRTA